MKGLRPLLLLVVAGVLGAVIGIVVLRARESTEALPRPNGPSISARLSVQPRVHVFGDTVQAEAEMLFDRRRVDAGTVRLDALLDPYEQVGSVIRVRSDAGNLVRLRFRYTLACFTPACAPTTDKHEVELQSARVIYTLVNPRTRAIDPVRWPPFEVVSRLGPFDVERARWRADLRRLPPVSYGVSPSVLAAGLGGAAFLLALAAAVLAGRLVPRRRTVEDDGEGERISSLERALAAVAATSANGSTPEQRKALERLARELGGVGHQALAGRARRLAWSSRQPSRGDVDELERDIRTVTEEER